MSKNFYLILRVKTYISLAGNAVGSSLNFFFLTKC